jgi:protein ImuB
LKEAGFESNVVAACTRFGAYALARAGSRTTVFESLAAEAALVRRVPLTRLDLEPEARDALRRLGLQTVGDWLRLPANGVRLRFGHALYEWQRQAEGSAWTPLQPRPDQPVFERLADLEHPERDAERLLFLVKRLLDELLDELRARTLELVALTLSLRLDDRSAHAERLCPAAPTRDGTQLLGLVRLRLEALRDGGSLRGAGKGIVALGVHVEALPARQGQLGLFERFARRDHDAAQRALARLRAEFGPQAVVRARLREAHLPSACFEWEPLATLTAAQPNTRVEVAPTRPAVRRLYVPPLPLPPRPRHEPDGWLLRGLEHGRVRRFVGPYLVSGGWWRGQAVQREYSFAELEGGELLWIYYDARRRRFFLEGRVE